MNACAHLPRKIMDSAVLRNERNTLRVPAQNAAYVGG
jgi:hypothetical protein